MLHNVYACSWMNITEIETDEPLLSVSFLFPLFSCLFNFTVYCNNNNNNSASLVLLCCPPLI